MPNAHESLATVEIDGALPKNWAPEGHDSTIALTGPTGTAGVVARIAIQVVQATGSIEEATDQLIEQFGASQNERLVASCDVWPHRQWGTGRLLQSAYVEGDITMAHDVYVFVDGDLELRVTLDCDLADLLAIEEDVATVVSRVRTTTQAATRGGTADRRRSIIRSDAVHRRVRNLRTACTSGLRSSGALR